MRRPLDTSCWSRSRSCDRRRAFCACSRSARSAFSSAACSCVVFALALARAAVLGAPLRVDLLRASTRRAPQGWRCSAAHLVTSSLFCWRSVRRARRLGGLAPPPTASCSTSMYSLRINFAAGWVGVERWRCIVVVVGEGGVDPALPLLLELSLLGVELVSLIDPGPQKKVAAKSVPRRPSASQVCRRYLRNDRPPCRRLPRLQHPGGRRAGGERRPAAAAPAAAATAGPRACWLGMRHRRKRLALVLHVRLQFCANPRNFA